jgi:hypothetical protein
VTEFENTAGSLYIHTYTYLHAYTCMQVYFGLALIDLMTFLCALESKEVVQALGFQNLDL